MFWKLNIIDENDVFSVRVSRKKQMANRIDFTVSIVVPFCSTSIPGMTAVFRLQASVSETFCPCWRFRRTTYQKWAAIVKIFFVFWVRSVIRILVCRFVASSRWTPVDFKAWDQIMNSGLQTVGCYINLLQSTKHVTVMSSFKLAPHHFKNSHKNSYDFIWNLSRCWYMAGMSGSIYRRNMKVRNSRYI